VISPKDIVTQKTCSTNNRVQTLSPFLTR